MSYLTIKDNIITYHNGESKEILLSPKDVILNQSRIPLHTLSDTPCLPLFLINLHNKYQNLFAEGQDAFDAADYLLIDSLLSTQLIKTALPVKVAEIGCMNGRLSYHLASLIAEFNDASTLCCICDAIGNESGNYWLEMISMVERAPKLSLVAAEYDDTNLCNGTFDCVIINGSITYKNVETTISEAKRLLAPTGTLICYAYQQPSLLNAVKQAFSSFKEYPMNNNTSIVIANATNAFPEPDEKAEWREAAKEDLLFAEAALLQKNNKDELFSIALKLDKHADYATMNGIIDMKLKCLELKEKLLIKYVG